MRAAAGRRFAAVYAWVCMYRCGSSEVVTTATVACIEYANQVASHRVPSLPLLRSPDLVLKGNVYGVGGHRTTLTQCLFDSGDSFGWNWTRGETSRECEDPEGLQACKAPACFADFSFAGVSYGVSPFGGSSVGATAGVMPIDTSALRSFTVSQNATFVWKDTAPGSQPPQIGLSRRTRFIYDFFLSSARPNGSSVASTITDEITISLAGNPGFPGSQPPGCLDPHSKYSNVSGGGPVLHNAVFDGHHHYDYYYTDHHDAVPNDGSRFSSFRRVGSNVQGARIPTSVDLLPFVEAVRQMWAGDPLPVGPFLGEVSIATELYDHTDGRVSFAEAPTYQTVAAWGAPG
jgi:hypothetical protein